MKPRRFVEARDPSPPATCIRILGQWPWTDRPCGAPMIYLITPNALSGLPYDYLVMRRCSAGHVECGDGVLRESGIPDGRRMTQYLAWRGGNGCYTKWHLQDGNVPFAGDKWTLCGKVAPKDAQEAGERRKMAKDTCKTCTDRQQREKR